jgi:hypothetical protein
MLSPECVLTVSFWSKYYLKAFFPIIMVSLVLGVDSWKENKKVQNRTRWKMIFSSRAHFLIAFIGLALYTSSVSTAFSPFNCFLTEDGLLVLARDPSVGCYDDQWMNNMFGIVLFLLLYPVAIPFTIAYVFFKNRKKRDSEEFFANWGFLTAPYHSSFFWWEMALLMKRTAFAIASEFLVSNFSWKVIMATLILFVTVVVETFVHPYYGRFRNFLNLW